MYGWLYRHLPSPRGTRPVVAALLLLAFGALLLFVVFPGVETILPNGKVTLGN